MDDEATYMRSGGRGNLDCARNRKTARSAENPQGRRHRPARAGLQTAQDNLREASAIAIARQLTERRVKAESPRSGSSRPRPEGATGCRDCLLRRKSAV